MADWLEFLLLTIAWTPVLVLLHELGHAAAAVLLTDGEVSVGGGVAFAGAWIATGHFLGSALPIRYGAGLRGAMESDGHVIWRILTGAPPGGIERELRHQGEPEPAARPVFVALLVLAGVLALLADPWLLAGLAVMFGLGMLMQQKT